MKKRERSRSMRHLTNFIFEAGCLKRVRRSGWSVLGIPDAESVADHSFRCAVIGYVLSRMENVSPYPVMLMTLLNDIHESRITDLHKMAQRYITVGPAEDTAFAEQISALPGAMKSELTALRADYTRQRSKESIIARDADILECLVQAKEYYEQGFSGSAHFMKKAPEHLKTASAKKLWRSFRVADIDAWWIHLADFRR